MKIRIERDGPTSPTDYSWQFGLGNDHAHQMLRSDVFEQAKRAHDELGIRYLRCHGIFDDDMLVDQKLSDNAYLRGLPGAKKIGQINFHQASLYLDNVLKAGLKPLLEISFMPTHLAKKKKIGFPYFSYNNCISQPRSDEEWSHFIRLFADFLLDYYGKEEVDSWYFEVWNEPDLKGFFRGSQKDYFHLYEVTARALKSADSSLRVGGPATSGCHWIREFKDFCQKGNVPLDFLSTHHYPGDGFGNAITFKSALKMMKDSRSAGKKNAGLGETYEKLFFHPEVYRGWKRGILAGMDEEALKEAGEIPLFIDEWSSMAVFGSPCHDEKYDAAFIIDTALRLSGRLPAYMYWCLSDVFEEQEQLNEPFHGSFGIIANNGIPKPNFWAFKILSMLYPERLDLPLEEGMVEHAAFRQGKDTQILLFDQEHDYLKCESEALEVELNAPSSAVYAYRIDDMHCNPKALWVELGRKGTLNPREVEQIKAASALEKEAISFSSENGETTVALTLGSNDVVLLECKGE